MEPVSRAELTVLAHEARERWSVPGLALGVLRDGRVTAAADGVCELGRADPVTPETVFRIASITKPFVAALALTVVQDGLLELDAPPPGSKIEATVRQLLSHQGGLACEWPEPLDPTDLADDALPRIAAGEPERLPVGPGELFSYCNVGFWLVGGAIARVLGTSFEEAMQARILDPLALTFTGFDPDAAAKPHNQLEPGADEHRAGEDAYPRARRPSGGLWSSVQDLLRFADHQLGGAGPLTAESVAEMQRPHIPTGSYAYGLGWFLSDLDGRRVVEHGGSAAGYESLLLLVPDDGIAFAALSNSSRGGAAIRDVREQLGLGQQELADAPLPAADLRALAGRYAGQGTELWIAEAHGRLRVALTEVDPFTGRSNVYPSVLARPVGPREFEIEDGEWRGERFDFPRDGLVCMGSLAARVE